MALIRMCVVPNCSQRLSRPILWIVAVCAIYWTHSTAVCLLKPSLLAQQLKSILWLNMKATLSYCPGTPSTWVQIAKSVFTEGFS